MCGISCFVRFRSTTTKTESQQSHDLASGISCELHKSLDEVNHRGPDSRGIWIDPTNAVALGQARLAINDLSPGGEQPFHDPSNQIHAVVNGELYDYEDFRAELETDYRFNGHSDCEIVVALYLEYGATFLTRLRGEFALCLYDERNQIFLAAKDRYGIKPLFWTVVNGRLLVCSEAKGFLALGWEPEWDVKSIKDGEWHYDSRTLFKGVNKVNPGCYLTCTLDGNIEQRRYWDINFPDKTKTETRSVEELIEGVRSNLVEAVRLRMRADVKVGVYLSGGIDSSAIAGIVTHLVKTEGTKIGEDDQKAQISCFTVAYDEDSIHDESPIAQRTAEYLGVKHHKKHMNEAELAKRFEDATWHCEHHNGDLNYVAKYALSELPRSLGYKVVLTGEGSDEIFSGYKMYLSDFLREADASRPLETQLPDSKRKEKRIGLLKALKASYGDMGADRAQPTPDSSLRMVNYATTATSLIASTASRLLASWTSVYGSSDPKTMIANSIPVDTLEKFQKWHPLHAAMYIWTKGYLQNILLTCLGDRTEMAHSIEARTPFLDHKLTEFAYGLPPSLKIKWDTENDEPVEKWVLREAVRPFITDELYRRTKKEFTAPLVYDTNGPLRQLFEKLLTKENIESLGFVDVEKVESLVEDAFVKQDAQAVRLSIILAQWVVLGRSFGVRRAVVPR